MGSTTIPALVDVPLHEFPVIVQTPGFRDLHLTEDDGFPVMVFSHGMASSRTQYTQYVGELASRGFVVAAIEHRDGSGPGTTIMKHDTPHRTLLHFSNRHLTHDSRLDTEAFKAAQLDFRQAEVEETVRILQRINHGSGERIESSNSRGEGQHLHRWKGRLAINNATIGGHSFGATLAVKLYLYVVLNPSLIRDPTAPNSA